jgi:hypothetical protein
MVNFTIINEITEEESSLMLSLNMSRLLKKVGAGSITPNHGLINYKDAKAKRRHLKN